MRPAGIHIYAEIPMRAQESDALLAHCNVCDDRVRYCRSRSSSVQLRYIVGSTSLLCQLHMLLTLIIYILPLSTTYKYIHATMR